MELKELIGQAESLVAEKIGKGEFEIVETKNKASAKIEVDGLRFLVGLDNFRKDLRPIGNERSQIKLNLSQEQSQAAYAVIQEEIERAEFERLNKKYGK